MPVSHKNGYVLSIPFPLTYPGKRRNHVDRNVKIAANMKSVVFVRITRSLSGEITFANNFIRIERDITSLMLVSQ